MAVKEVVCNSGMGKENGDWVHQDYVRYVGPGRLGFLSVGRYSTSARRGRLLVRDVMDEPPANESSVRMGDKDNLFPTRPGARRWE